MIGTAGGSEGGSRPPVPGLPVGRHLAPGAADDVLADRPTEQGGQRPAYPARVRARQIGPGDQRLGLARAALVGRNDAALPLPRAALGRREAGGRAADHHGPERARQRALAVAVALRRCGCLAITVPLVALAQQAGLELL